MFYGYSDLALFPPSRCLVKLSSHWLLKSPFLPLLSFQSRLEIYTSNPKTHNSSPHRKPPPSFPMFIPRFPPLCPSPLFTLTTTQPSPPSHCSTDPPIPLPTSPTEPPDLLNPINPDTRPRPVAVAPVHDAAVESVGCVAAGVVVGCDEAHYLWKGKKVGWSWKNERAVLMRSGSLKGCCMLARRATYAGVGRIFVELEVVARMTSRWCCLRGEITAFLEIGMHGWVGE